MRRARELHESNPMLGHRGCRLGLIYPEVTRMQARAVFEALDLFPASITDAWYGLYTTGERRFYDQLVGAGE